LNDLYEIGNQISSGNFATVRLCRNKNTNVYSAVKRIDMQENSDDMIKVKKEVEILKKMNHANIIKLVEEFEMNGYFYLVMELITDGDIISTIMNSKYYSEQDVSGMVHNVMSGILYLHSINIVHRDIKMENVLVQKNRNGLKKLKICDFGLATIIANNEILKTVCGTPNYMAPEIILQVGYGNKVDVWSVGIFMYILLYGSPPFHSRSNDFNKIFENVIVGKYDLNSTTWESVSEEAKTLITMLLEPNPTNRMTAEEALSYPWVSKDQFARNINLRPTIGNKLQKYYRNSAYVMKKGNNVLANTALDKESNYFEKAQNE
ncbi:hypothetical protein HELRODRAFT_141692, partial [Helobdella robusta]|uniref:Protein kinase domain-containing protein n=1 Tax=Helobdella robusta TaxID=6412 RepID=T1EJ40_HELRO